MAIGRSLHIGVLVPAADSGMEYDALEGSENDAIEMEKLANEKGFEQRRVILGPEATAERVLDEIADAASELHSGDFFFVSFSGHGSQVPTVIDFDDEDGRVETWVLYNRELLDKELSCLWNRFQSGVRILVVVDACHSATSFFVPADNAASERELTEVVSPPTPSRDGRRIKTPTSHQRHSYLTTTDFDYGAKLEECHACLSSTALQARVLGLTACPDDQETRDGYPNSEFTTALLVALQSGDQADYNQLREAIYSAGGTSVDPQLTPYGTSFAGEAPFQI
jgi:hypothetical protein